VVLDNLSTHKPNRDMWLSRHKNVHFHYTPTHAYWLSQIEIFFSILTSQSLNGASFTSVKMQWRPTACSSSSTACARAFCSACAKTRR